jgi:Fe-S cluster biogenesis protein NfuA
MAETTEVGLKEQVEQSIDEIRPALQSHGGDIELIDVSEDGVVQVRLEGACCGCPHAAATLHLGVERFLREAVPKVTRVVNVGEGEGEELKVESRKSKVES